MKKYWGIKMDELHIILTEKMLTEPFDFKLPKKRLYIDRSNVGLLHEREHNFIGLARHEKYAKEFLIRLASVGFYLVDLSNKNSKFEKFTTATEFKHNIKVDKFEIYGDALYYTLDKPKLELNMNRLLVVFSSVADFPYNASIARRNFFTNFPSISKYIPDNTYILRIADIGGVVGSFYMNTEYNREMEKDIQELIEFILISNSILKEDVILYGASKGATGALYHSILGKYKAVAVDPIVSDEYHETVYNDSLFTQGSGNYRIYPESKQLKFINLMKRNEISDDINIIYSEQSPIYTDINTIIKDNDMKQKINYINICHPKIKSHPDVGSNTINILMLVLNNIFYNLKVIKSVNIDCEKKLSKKNISVKASLKLTKMILEVNNFDKDSKISLRAYNLGLNNYKDIELSARTTEVSLFKLKKKLLLVISEDERGLIECEIKLDLSNSSILSRLVTVKRIEKNGVELSFLAIV